MTARRKTPIPSDNLPLSEAEAAHLRSIIEPRLKALDSGTAYLLDLDQAFDEVETEIFGTISRR